jgi:ATP-dependent Lhr-like helicase
MMSSPHSNSESRSIEGFERLHPEIQRWVWSKGWSGLRDAQERAIRPLLDGERDVIISAATAAGKTEAAFLPILTTIANAGEEGALAIYISPLKALINDQWGRLGELCESLEISVVPWHGDITQSRKDKFIKYPRGVLLITPESLEALFVRRGTQIPRLFGEARYVVIDELHAFIGTDRGKQMQSLLGRLEQAVSRRIIRVGLSATLGDMSLACQFLRPGPATQVESIVSESAHHDLQLQIRGYICSSDLQNEEISGDEPDGAAENAVADHLYKTLRGSNNLIFPNSRKGVEFYADALRKRCEANLVPLEFWPHHGSLSKYIREETERALKQKDRTATAICTTTLELGIDIGAVKSVAQIGPPPSVASLRQRLGRSGRRVGEPAILRSYNIEREITTKSSVSDRLREALVQSIATVQLLTRKWCEPPNSSGLHLSTLIQQIMSVIAERSGATAQELYQWLVVQGAFRAVSTREFADVLRSMGSKDLLMQDATGLLLLGGKGEKAVGSYDFYAAFVSEEEWEIESQGTVMGSLPVRTALRVDMKLIFAGRRWRVTEIHEESRTISVIADPGGAPPMFGGGRGSTHDEIRRLMRTILEGTDKIGFLDATAERLLQEARSHYAQLRLSQRRIVRAGNSVALFTWAGDPTNDALVLLLQGLGVKDVSNERLYLEVTECADDRLHDLLADASDLRDVDYLSLLADTSNLSNGKWDWVLPEALLKKSYASSNLSFEGARKVASELMDELRF